MSALTYTAGPLTPREIAITSHIVAGQANKEIARNLGISPQTVKNHVTSIIRKLDLYNRTQLAVWGARQGLGLIFELLPDGEGTCDNARTLTPEGAMPPPSLPDDHPSDYEAAGVDTDCVEQGLSRLTRLVQSTWPEDGTPGAVQLPVGYFANVVAVGGQGIAFTTDGVGTKVLVAQLLDRYDTVGIDCVAMNVNDLLCVGATPVSLVDYLAVQDADPHLMEQIAVGLVEGARQAGVSIPGGETAQLRDVIAGIPGRNGFDLAASAIGTVPLDRILVGQHIQPGDILIGLESNGLHSNGFTLARHALLEQGGLSLDARLPDLPHTLGEELLRPTFIYVPEAVEILNAGLDVKALIHITGDGFFNLARVASPTGFVIDQLPPIPPIFRHIQERGRIADAEMFRVFNMGIGFVFVVSPSDGDRLIEIAARYHRRAHRIGYTTHDADHTIHLVPYGLIGRDKHFTAAE